MSRQKKDLGVVYEPPTLSWYLVRIFILLAAVGALVIGFVIHYRSVIPIIPALSLVFGVVVLAVVVLSLIWKLMKHDRTQAVTKAVAQMPASWLNPVPGHTAIIRGAHKRILKNLAVWGFLDFLAYFYLPSMPVMVQKWWSSVSSTVVPVPLCVLVTIMAFTFILIPQYILFAIWLKRIAWISFIAGVVVDVLLLRPGTVEIQPEMATILIGVWNFLWMPIIIPYGWLLIGGVPLGLFLAQMWPFTEKYDEPDRESLLPLAGIVGLDIWIFFHQHLSLFS